MDDLKHKHAHNHTASAIIWSIAGATLLAVLKLMTGVLTNSMAILASALDSGMDAASSTINYIAAREAAKPPDEDHEYGHGKIESLASLFQSMAIGVSGIFLIVESIRRLARGSFVHEIGAGIAVMGFSLFVTLFIIARLTFAQKKTGSLILSTEKLHYTTDIFTNGGALLALVLVKYTGIVALDLIFSTAVAAYIFKTSYGILRQAVDELLDKSLPPVAKEEISQLIHDYHPAMGGLHNFRSRRVGSQIFMDFHIEIRGEDDFKKAHHMTEGLIAKIRERYHDADVTVHYDPEGES